MDNIKYFPIEEAIAITTNRPFVKVAHKYFSNDEYVYGDGNGNLIDESGYMLPSDEFWAIRIDSMKSDWYIKEK